MNLKQQIEQDLKTAMLAGDKLLASTIRGIKSAILYEEVARSKRAEGLSDQEIVEVLVKEAKKRQESADLYKQGGDDSRAAAEIDEKKVIEQYLPVQLTEEELNDLIDMTMRNLDASGQQAMGQVIAEVKKKAAGRADGGTIARLVKEKLL